MVRDRFLFTESYAKSIDEIYEKEGKSVALDCFRAFAAYMLDDEVPTDEKMRAHLKEILARGNIRPKRMRCKT